ncbi:MAG: HAD family phosphatase [Acidimicrobiia bacterium]|nr:HAD family phosphatase [Acidimicrobiia bacterium]
MNLHGLAADAVLFDCDGVLVDSEPISFRAWRAALAAHGFDLDEASFRDSVGGTDSMVAERFGPQVGADPLRLEREARAAFEEFATAAHPFTDTVALVERVEASGTPLAVATNGLRWRLDVLLAAVGLGRLLTHSVTADEVARPKPAPDLYRAAARIAGVEPSRCVVVEDSPTGIAAARAAGCRVVAIDRGMFSTDRLAAADVVVAEA